MQTSLRASSFLFLNQPNKCVFQGNMEVFIDVLIDLFRRDPIQASGPPARALGASTSALKAPFGGDPTLPRRHRQSSDFSGHET